MTTKDGEMEYGTDNVASIKANDLTIEQIIEILNTQVAMPELDINPDDPDEYEMHPNGEIEARNGDYRWIYISGVKTMPKAHFDIMTKYNINAFFDLLPPTKGFQFR